MTDDKLNKTISDVAYILDSLILLRQIQQTGDCNICKNRDCGYMPKAGQMVRYNCPFYKAESEVKV
jgi:transposase